MWKSLGLGGGGESTTAGVSSISEGQSVPDFTLTDVNNDELVIRLHALTKEQGKHVLLVLLRHLVPLSCYYSRSFLN